MEVINYLEEDQRNHKGMLAWAIITLMTDTADPGDTLWKFDKVDGSKLEVECRINGVEVSFTKLMNHVEAQMDQLIAEAADKLINEKFRRLDDTLTAARRKCREVLGLGEDDY